MRQLNTSILILLFIGVALIGYFLPWVLTQASSLSLGAYDLAEWSSLHPVVRQTVPFLWTTLALRVPFAIVGILLATHIRNVTGSPTLAIIILLVTAIALLPPLEFFTTYRDDPNYRQQFTIILLTLIIGFPTIIGKPKRLQTRTLIGLSVLGVITSVMGLYQANSLLQGFELHTAIGLGGVITSIAFVAVTYLYITKQSS
jgi:hypothetical protein